MTKGLSGAGFDIDLSEAKKRERSLAAILASKGMKVEVKSDKECRNTGNLFIEFEQPSGPSGIATTEAEWWAFEYHDDCWLIVPVHRVRQLARRAYRLGQIRRGGDHDKYRGVLVPLMWFVDGAAIRH